MQLHSAGSPARDGSPKALFLFHGSVVGSAQTLLTAHGQCFKARGHDEGHTA